MKGFGALLAFLGGVILVVAFSMDTTLAVPGGGSYGIPDRVNNIGLMDQRRNYMIVAGLVILCGVMLIGFGSVAKTSETESENDNTKRKCPACAEFVKAEATICRFCNHALPPLPTPAELAAQAAAYAALSPEEKAIADQNKPKGICPNCDQIIPLDTVECKCGARFGPMSTWKIKPV